VSAISGFCEKCNKFRKRHCDGNRNTCMSILFDTIEALQQEIEQLEDENASMRNWNAIFLLRRTGTQNGELPPDGERWKTPMEIAMGVLSTDIDQDYHNPDDVEALRKAREALCKGISELKVHCKYFDNTPEEDACIEMHEAILEIDKAIGGKEDV